jgi:hypothetical protein
VYQEIQEKSNQIIKFEDAVNYTETRRKYALFIKRFCLIPPFSIFTFVLIGPFIICFKQYLTFQNKRKNMKKNLNKENSPL